MESRPDYFANREQRTQAKRARVLAALAKLKSGDPIAVEIGSTENDMIVLDTLFIGLTPDGNVRALSIEGTQTRPSIEVVEFPADWVRPHGFRDGARRDGLKEEAFA
ncbi:MAG: hypothetical protein Q8J63_00670 [Candidatus Aquicultor sp.]|nr:hypothetical protein [Candidatus Aquicultor sp.]